MYPAIHLKSGREYPLRQYHPWVFSGAIAQTSGKLEDGQIVEVYSDKKQFLGVGFWGSSSIAVKILSFQKVQIDQKFWLDKLQAAKSLRQSLGLIGNPDTNSFRICNAEGDGLPGIIIDMYDKNIVVQIQAEALSQFQNEISGALDQLYRPDSIVIRTKEESRVGFGEIASNIMSEAGIKYRVDLLDGQKTGFFLDQRDNRALVGSLAKGKKVLNAFSYSGGFSLAALAAGAEHVTSVDYSGPAIELLKENLKLNNFEKAHTSVTADFFDFLKEDSNKYDIIVLDPPAFCKHRDAVENALKGYSNINQQSMLKLSENGLLFTFSCSQLVSREQFREAVSIAASRAGKRMRILKELNAAPCHPVALGHPEGVYLKGLLLSF